MPDLRKRARLAPRELSLATAILIIGVAVTLRFPRFAAPGSLAEVANDTSLLLILALGEMLVLLTGGVDLSIAANVALSGMLAALFNAHYPEAGILPVLAVAIGSGAIMGAVNGAAVRLLKAPPIVASLATLAIFRGLTYFVSGGQWVNSNLMSADFLGFQKLSFLGLTTPSWLCLLLIAGVAVLLHRTRLGRSLFMAGDNPEAARLIGVRPERAQFWAFVLAGGMAGAVGYFWVSRYGVAYTDTAVGFELQVIAACVIGGVSIVGGAGAVAGVVLGALLLGVVRNAMPLLGISPFWQMAVSGLIILLAVLGHAAANKPRRQPILEPETR